MKANKVDKDSGARRGWEELRAERQQGARLAHDAGSQAPGNYSTLCVTARLLP